MKRGYTMKYYAVFLKMKDIEKSNLYRQEHIDFLTEMRQKNRIFMYGKLANDAGGLIIYQGEHKAEVESWVKQDPYIMLHAREYELHEWNMQTDYSLKLK